MNNEELIKDVMRLDYSQLVMNCVGNIEEITRLRKDIEYFKRYVRIVNTIELHCLNSIYAINDILKTEKITKFSKNGICLNRNKYQIERLKAYRTKSKEILKLIRRLENTYYGKEVK